MKLWIYMGIALLVMLFIQVLYPRLTTLLTRMNHTETTQEWREQYGETPITIVPNDYVEEE